MHKKSNWKYDITDKNAKRILTLTRTGNIFNLQDKCTRVQHDAARIVEGYLLDEAE